MSFEMKQGDLFGNNEKIILHGVNCQGVMGSGVAKIIRDRYPEAYDDYRKIHENGGISLGNIYPVTTKGGVTIINAATQFSYGRDPTVRYASYDAIARAMRILNNTYYNKRVAMPMIGAGLGNAKWSIVETIIKEYAPDVEIVVYSLEGV